MAGSVSSWRIRKNCAISRNICVDHYILLLKHLSNHMHFKTNSFRTFFLDQLARSKSTCSFKVALHSQIKWQQECYSTQFPHPSFHHFSISTTPPSPSNILVGRLKLTYHLIQLEDACPLFHRKKCCLRIFSLIDFLTVDVVWKRKKKYKNMHTFSWATYNAQYTCKYFFFFF